MLLNHELEIPWRETKFEQAANFSGALKGLFLHVELIQPRRAASGHGRHNDAQSPNPAFTPAQYDRLALLYVIATCARSTGSFRPTTPRSTPISLTATTIR